MDYWLRGIKIMASKQTTKTEKKHNGQTVYKDRKEYDDGRYEEREYTHNIIGTNTISTKSGKIKK